MRQRLSLAVLLMLAGGALLVRWKMHAATRPAPPPAPPTANATSNTPRATRLPIFLSDATVRPEADARAGELEGHVLSTGTGRGVPSPQLVFLHAGAAITVAGDATGGFRLLPHAPGRYELSAVTAAGHLPFSVEIGHSPIAFEARAGTRVGDVTLYLSPAVDYLGVVLDPDGKPLAGADVRSLDPAPEGEGEPAHFRSDARGEVHFHAADGTLFEARHPRYAPARASVDTAVQVSHKLVLRLKAGSAVPADGVIAGVVLDAAKVPVEGAQVTASFEAPKDAEELHAALSTTSGADGRFRLDGLEAGPHHVQARAPGFSAAQAAHVQPGRLDLTLTLVAGGAVRGVVRGRSTAKALPAFTIVVTRRIGRLERGESVSASIFDAEGRYLVRGLAPGPWVVTAVAHGHAPAQEQEIEIAAPPAEPAEASFSLGAGGRVSGTVIDRASRAAITGARISLEGMILDDSSPVTVRSSTTSDAGGHFELGGLRAGLRSILVAAEGHHTRILSALQVAEDGDVGPLTVDLAPTEPGEEPRIELVGIGAVLTADQDVLGIVRVIPGGGAEAAGLQPGDRVLSIDGVSTAELGFAGAVERIRGPEDTVVQLVVARGADGAPRPVPVSRKRLLSGGK